MLLVVKDPARQAFIADLAAVSLVVVCRYNRWFLPSYTIITMWSISISSSSSLLCLLLLFLSTKTAIAERHKQKSSNSNYGQKLIYEKLDRFARSPVNALKLMKDYFRMGGFPNNLTLADREQALKYILSLEKSLGKTGL